MNRDQVGQIGHGIFTAPVLEVQRVFHVTNQFCCIFQGETVYEDDVKHNDKGFSKRTVYLNYKTSAPGQD